MHCTPPRGAAPVSVQREGGRVGAQLSSESNGAALGILHCSVLVSVLGRCCPAGHTGCRSCCHPL